MTLSKDPIKAAEQRERISAAAKKSHADPQWKEKQRLVRLKLWEDPTYREKSISNSKIAMQDQSVKIKISNGVKNAHIHKKKEYELGYKKRALNPNMTSESANLKRSLALRGDKCHLFRNADTRKYCNVFYFRRKSVREFFNHICFCCGMHRDENAKKVKGGNFKPIELDVHHIDHDKEQGCNGKSFSLVPLCRSCNALDRNHPEEYERYIIKALREGFKWGIWSEEEYIQKVMYSEKEVIERLELDNDRN